jgi:hypothetical protein
MHAVGDGLVAVQRLRAAARMQALLALRHNAAASAVTWPRSDDADDAQRHAHLPT